MKKSSYERCLPRPNAPELWVFMQYENTTYTFVTKISLDYDFILFLKKTITNKQKLPSL